MSQPIFNRPVTMRDVLIIWVVYVTLSSPVVKDYVHELAGLSDGSSGTCVQVHGLQEQPMKEFEI